jgi:hypothetical protein
MMPKPANSGAATNDLPGLGLFASGKDREPPAPTCTPFRLNDQGNTSRWSTRQAVAAQFAAIPAQATDVSFGLDAGARCSSTDHRNQTGRGTWRAWRTRSSTSIADFFGRRSTWRSPPPRGGNPVRPTARADSTAGQVLVGPLAITRTGGRAGVQGRLAAIEPRHPPICSPKTSSGGRLGPLRPVG